MQADALALHPGHRPHFLRAHLHKFLEVAVLMDQHCCFHLQLPDCYSAVGWMTLQQ